MGVMKKNLFFLLLTAALGASPADLPFVQEPDQTDIYAIPLDEDADEQDQELDQLEHYKK